MMSLFSPTLVDGLIILILLISGILATLRGMTREILGLLGWIVAVVATRLVQPTALEWIGQYSDAEPVNDALSWGIPFFIIAVIWFIIANSIAPGIRKFGLGALDRLLGFGFGILRGFVIIALFYMAALFVVEDEAAMPDEIRSSALMLPVQSMARAMTGLAPENIREDMEQAIPDPQLGKSLKEGIRAGIDKGAQKTTEAGSQLLEDEKFKPPPLTKGLGQ